MAERMPEHPDPYLWLEDVEEKEALDWVRAHNELTRAALRQTAFQKDIAVTVEKTSIGKNNVYKVTGGEQQLLICLENKLASETVKELTDKSQKGKIFICLESALDDTTAANLSLNLDLKTI